VVRIAEDPRGTAARASGSTGRRFQGNPREAEIVRVSYHPGPSRFIPEVWLAWILCRPESIIGGF
jgi:hypothetical protein